MKNILRILVPVDFSKESELALDWAQLVSKGKTGATIYLLHVLPLAEKPKQLGMASVGYQLEKEAITQRMKAWQKRLPSEVLSFPLYETGPIPKAIARACEEKNIDLVIMTTRGRRGLTRVLEGSTTEETVRMTPCPVLVLHLNSQTQNLAHAPSASAKAT